MDCICSLELDREGNGRVAVKQMSMKYILMMGGRVGSASYPVVAIGTSGCPVLGFFYQRVG
jgi:hypothetical protein